MPRHQPRRSKIASREGAVVIANATLWGIVLIGSALALRGTGIFSEIQLVLGGGAGMSNLVVAVGILRRPEQ